MDFVNPDEKQIKINGLNVNYKIIGDGGMPIILLHGWGIDSDKYSKTAWQLFLQTTNYKQQITIFAPDLPGFGKSDNPPEAWGVSDYAEWLKNFVSTINLSSFILIGHSFGGRIAVKFAAKYPEKLRVLILTGSAGVKHPLTVKQKLFYALAKIGKAIFSLPLINSLEKPAKKLLYKVAREKDYYRAQGVTKETFRKVIDEDLTPYLEDIKIPALLIWGQNDCSTPLGDAYIMMDKIKGSELKIVENSNHSLPYQKPEEFAKIVAEFIRKNR